jgi:hypothetical protein
VAASVTGGPARISPKHDGAAPINIARPVEIVRDGDFRAASLRSATVPPPLPAPQRFA